LRQTKQTWFEETETVYSEILEHLVANLNSIHSVNFSKRFWDIFVGAWLREFTELVMLQKFDSEKAQARTPASTESPTISSLVEYRKLSKHPRFIENLRFDICSKKNSEGEESVVSQSNPILTRTNQKKTKLGSSYLSATYLDRISEVALQVRFLRMPEKLMIASPPLASRNESLRNNLNVFHNKLGPNSATVVSLLSKYLPSVYLESFNSLHTTIKPWRRKRYPRVIFTANRHLYDDVFNYWTACAVENGSNLVIAQHGGHYGISEFPSCWERHEFDIADRYMSWGWNSRDKSLAGPALILVRQNFIKRNNARQLIVVTDQLFTYPRSLFGDIDESSPYLWNIKDLVKNVESRVNTVLVRIPITHNDSGHSQIDWFNEHLPQTAVDTGEQKFRHLLKQAKLVVIPHNGTTLIESIALGVPTIIFWDKSIVWMRSEAEVVFNALEQVGIFHRTPESASSFINSIWDDVDGWWNSQATIDARKQFTDQYARSVPNPIRFLAKALQF
jgi:putative transferase (TIGR04331 family)